MSILYLLKYLMEWNDENIVHTKNYKRKHPDRKTHVLVKYAYVVVDVWIVLWIGLSSIFIIRRINQKNYLYTGNFCIRFLCFVGHIHSPCLTNIRCFYLHQRNCSVCNSATYREKLIIVFFIFLTIVDCESYITQYYNVHIFHKMLHWRRLEKTCFRPIISYENFILFAFFNT